MNLVEKINRWGQLQAQIEAQLAGLKASQEMLLKEQDALKQEIEVEIMALKQSQKLSGDYGTVSADYSAGRGSYDYEKAAIESKVSQDIVDKHTTPKIDWLKVCKDAKVDTKAYFTEGKPSFSIKLVK